MAVKYRIEYCNASNDTARLDIYVRDYSGSIIPVEGSADLFLLEYKADNYIISSIADIQIYNSESFNIDVLKTSDETELKALFYVNGILKWNGFILPDFFSTELTDNSVISMTATDRLSVLKDVTLTYSTAKISYIKLISDCLIKTGLEMDINVVADFMQVSQPSTFNIMDCYVEHSRITSRNKSLSAYDVLKSVLILLNAKLMQYGGAWWIVNRYQAQTTGGRIFTYNEVGVLQTSGTFTPQQIPFTLVEASGRRTIEPVASQTSVFMEFGGVKRYPADYEFKNYSGGYEGWTAVNGFNYTYSDKEVLSYNTGGGAIYGTRDIEPRMRQYNDNADFYLFTSIQLSYLKYIKSTPVTNNIDGKIKVNVMLNATGMNDRFMPILIVIDTKNADTSKRYYAYGRDGIVSLTPSFVTTVVNISAFQFVRFSDNDVPETSALNAVSNLDIELDPSDVNAQTLVGADISLFMFGAGCNVFVNEASIGISNISDGKGVLYRVEQGAGNYTKKHDTDTTIFGDYILQGINGFFYNYTSDELSIHTYLSNRINGGWTSPGDTQSDPILLHSVRQRARMYSKAKNVFNVQITEAFNPLGIYTCGGNSYIVRSAKHNFLRSETNVEMEEIVYQDLSKIDFVYTYFGDEKDKSITGISGISGISGGGASTAVPSHDNLKGITTITDTLEDGATTIHLTKEVAVSLLSTITNFNSWFELDTTVTPNAIKVTKDFYSVGEISAYGAGSGSGGGGTSYSRLDEWSLYTNDKSGWVLSALLGKDLHDRVNTHTHLWADITDKPSTFAPSAHTHTWNDIQNIPSVFAPDVHDHYVTDILNFPTSMPASDVYDWAKAATKPSYTASEIGGLGTNYRWLTDAYIATWNSKANGTHTHSLSEIGITGLSTDYLPKFNGSTLVNSLLYDNGTNVGIGTAVPTEKVEILGSAFINNGSLYIGSKLSRISTNLTTGSYDFNYNTGATGQLAFYGGGTTSVWNVDALGNGYFSGNVGIGTTNPTATLDVNGTGKFKDDILMTFNTWTHATDKNSLNKFLKLFDIDTAGNLVVKTNLYSTGEVTAYSSGTGVSGLKLMGDMNANNKAIYSALSISVGDMTFGYVGDKMGLHEEITDATIAAFDENDYNYYFADNKLIYDNTNNIFSVTGQVNATEFKFGNYSFKQSANGLSICFNGVEQAYITDTGQYVNS